MPSTLPDTAAPAPSAPDPTGSVGVDQQTRATALQAALLAEADPRAAAALCVRRLAAELGMSRVSIGFLDGQRLQLLASSDDVPGAAADARAAPSALREQLAAAIAEALDQRATVAVPEPRDQQPRITLAHRRLRDGQGGAVASLPIAAGGVCVGGLCVERHGAGSLSAGDLAGLELLLAQVGPVLHLMRLNARPLHTRLLQAPRASWQRLRAHPRQPAFAAAAVLLLLLLLWPADVRVGGHARLEGEVQRVLVAPADGFLAQVHVRPGDAVRAGQVLLELADRDLKVEARRWESQVAQFEDATAAANARADRAQLVINQARGAEAEAQLALATMKLARAQLTAPFDAIVIQGDLSQTLGAPVQQGNELMTLAPLDRFRVMVQVDERDIASVRVGQRGSVALSALPWNTQAIRVRRISPVAVAVEGRNVFEVEAELEAQPADLAALRPGLQGSAQLVTGRAGLAWMALRRPVDATRLLWWEWWG